VLVIAGKAEVVYTINLMSVSKKIHCVLCVLCVSAFELLGVLGGLGGSSFLLL
jgi:hypothetical protein